MACFNSIASCKPRPLLERLICVYTINRTRKKEEMSGFLNQLYKEEEEEEEEDLR
jgi:hypothetical protein